MANTKNTFLYQAHSEEKNEKWYPSSKRLYGGIGFITCQLCIIAATILSLVITGELSSTVTSLLDFDMITSASLLGLSTITRAFNGSKTVVNDSKSDSNTNMDTLED